MLIADLLSRTYVKDKVKDDPEMEYGIHSVSNKIAMSDQKKEISKKLLMMIQFYLKLNILSVNLA